MSLHELLHGRFIIFAEIISPDRQISFMWILAQYAALFGTFAVGDLSASRRANWDVTDTSGNTLCLNIDKNGLAIVQVRSPTMLLFHLLFHLLFGVFASTLVLHRRVLSSPALLLLASSFLRHQIQSSICNVHAFYGSDKEQSLFKALCIVFCCTLLRAPKGYRVMNPASYKAAQFRTL